MQVTNLELPDDPQQALATILATPGTVLVFKRSPICPVSFAAERELDAWLAARPGGQALALARIDVIGRRALARGLTAALEVRHESPQALVWRDGQLVWNASHGHLTRDAFAAACDGLPSRS